MSFTVEIITSPASDGWAVHRSVLDTVPGTLLLEDQEEPMLVLPVDEKDPFAAARFVDGVCKVMGLTVVSGTVYPTPALDVDLGDEDETPAESPTVTRVRDWMDRTPDIRQDEGCTADGKVLA